MKKRLMSYFSDQGRVEFWDRVYDGQDIRAVRYNQRMDLTLSWLDDLGLSRNSVILDVGCGAGRVANAVAQRGYSVFAVDYSHEMLVSASRVNDGKNALVLRFLQGDIESLPIQDSTFDFVICLGVISYIPSVDAAFAELARILKPGGVLAVSFLNRARVVQYFDPLQLLARRTKRIIRHINSLRNGGMEGDNQVRRVSYFIPRIRTSLEQSGFRVLEQRTIPYETLTFLDMMILPRSIASRITLFFEQFSNVPIVGAFGGMCLIKAEKQSTVDAETPKREY